MKITKPERGDDREQIRTTVTLSEQQRHMLQTALECGYFEVPRGISQKELADELGCSHQSLSERMRRVMNHLVTALVRSDPLETTRKWATSIPQNCSNYHHDSSCPRLLSAKKPPKPVSENAVEHHDMEPCPECIASRSLWIETENISESDGGRNE